MKSTVYKVLWLISGILLIVAGVFCIINPQATLLSLAIVLGVFMLVSGILNIVAFAGAHNEIFGSGWLLVEGILNCIIGVFLLFNEWITVAALPFIFGMWVLFSGLCRLIGSFDMKKLGLRSWGWMLFFGILGIAIGIFSFFKPFVAMLAISILVGIYLILEGAATIFGWGFARKIL